MENKYLIGLGAIALGMFAYSRYTKKDNSGQAEDPNTGGGGGGGGIGGGGFLPNPPLPPTPPLPPLLPPTNPRPSVTFKPGVVMGVPTSSQMNNTVVSGITPSGVSGTGTNTGGITGAGTGTTTGSGSGGTSVTVKYNPNDNVVRMFDGSEINCKTPIYLNDLVRSWNRP